jgi:hypothetical protein
MFPRTLKSKDTALLDRVRSILDGKGLTIHELSRLSERTFGQSSRYFISPNFYYDLRIGTVFPNIYQLFALSHFSNYVLVDWLRVFGFQLDDIPRLQTLLSRRRTATLNSTNYDKETRVPWFRVRETPLESNMITPLARIVTRAAARRVGSIERGNKKSFLYAKVGLEDALAFPELVPGSVLRVDPGVTSESDGCGVVHRSQPLYLVEHSKGLTCCRLKFIDTERVALISDHLPLATPEFRLGKEIRILGVADLEIHPLKNIPYPQVSAEFSKEWVPAPLQQSAKSGSLGELLCSCRLRSELAFREASRFSKEIAEELGDTRYFMTPRSFLSYEKLDTPPRHIHKIMSLCIIYSIAFWDFLSSAGMNIEQLGREPVPDALLPHVLPSRLGRPPREDDTPPQLSVFPETLFEEIPLFLRSSLPGLAGLPGLSIRDVFWTGGSRQLFHPLLTGSWFVIVNRRMKRAVPSWPSMTGESPLCLILMRDGTYICSPCLVKEGTLTLYPHPGSSPLSITLRNREEAEIIGRVVAIVRRL